MSKNTSNQLTTKISTKISGLKKTIWPVVDDAITKPFFWPEKIYLSTWTKMRWGQASSWSHAKGVISILKSVLKLMDNNALIGVEALLSHQHLFSQLPGWSHGLVYYRLVVEPSILLKCCSHQTNNKKNQGTLKRCLSSHQYHQYHQFFPCSKKTPHDHVF